MRCFNINENLYKQLNTILGCFLVLIIAGNTHFFRKMQPFIEGYYRALYPQDYAENEKGEEFDDLNYD